MYVVLLCFVPRFAVANRYAWPSLGFYMMRYLRSGQMKKFYADWLGVPLWWIAVTVALALRGACCAAAALCGARGAVLAQ